MEQSVCYNKHTYLRMVRVNSVGFVFKLFLTLLTLLIGALVCSFWALDSADLESDLLNDEVHDSFVGHMKNDEGDLKLEIKDPVIVWWTPFTNNQGSTKTCGSHQCFFTVNRNYKRHPHLAAFLFYGSDFNYGDLPLPRSADHDWALLHEESPKNNMFLFCHKEVMSLFNYTSTFKRQSDAPLTTLYLDHIESIESRKYLVSTAEKTRLMKDEGLALVSFVHSDCDTPSDRDTIVKMLQRFIKVDSYGKCLHNKDLPKQLMDPIAGMNHHDFYNILAKYKFTFATENAVCDDYITEKFWRSFHVGSVPIVFGSPKIEDWLPDEHSAIVLKDFKNIEDLVKLLLHLNSSDSDYNRYLSFKTKHGVVNKRLLDAMKFRNWSIDDWHKPNFVSNFECLVCRNVHERLKREKHERLNRQATVEHYGCPRPTKFSNNPIGNLEQVESDSWWAQEWSQSSFTSKALYELIQEKREFTKDEVDYRAKQLMRS